MSTPNSKTPGLVGCYVYLTGALRPVARVADVLSGGHVLLEYEDEMVITPIEDLSFARAFRSRAAVLRHWRKQEGK